VGVARLAGERGGNSNYHTQKVMTA
jgi:hypothetical protein